MLTVACESVQRRSVKHHPRTSTSVLECCIPSRFLAPSEKSRETRANVAAETRESH